MSSFFLPFCGCRTLRAAALLFAQLTHRAVCVVTMCKREHRRKEQKRHIKAQCARKQERGAWQNGHRHPGPQRKPAAVHKVPDPHAPISGDASGHSNQPNCKYRVAAKSKLERANVDAHQQDAAHAAKLFQPAEKRFGRLCRFRVHRLKKHLQQIWQQQCRERHRAPKGNFNRHFIRSVSSNSSGKCAR